jgi:hypothetical protein
MVCGQLMLIHWYCPPSFWSSLVICTFLTTLKFMPCMNFGLHVLDQKYFVLFDETLTLLILTLQLEVCVWVKCQVLVVISFSWFYALFVWSQPNTCKNNPKYELILCFLKLKLIPDFYCIFFTSDNGKLSIFCIHTVPQRNTITVLLLFRLGQSQTQTDLHTTYGHMCE